MGDWPGGCATPYQEWRQQCPGDPGVVVFDLSSPMECGAGAEISTARVNSANSLAEGVR